jgi:PrtD family type I secretion system ABC transporter
VCSSDLGILEAARSFALIGLSTVLDHKFSNHIFAAMFESSGLSHNARETTQPMRDFEVVKNFLATKAFAGFLDIPWIPVFAVFLYWVHPALGTFAILVTLVMFGATVWQSRMGSSAKADSAEIAAREYSFAQAGIRNSDVAQGMGMYSPIHERWYQLHQRTLTVASKQAEIEARFSVFTNSAQIIIPMILTIGLAALLVLENEITAGTMFVASFLIQRLMAPTMMFMSAWQQAMNARAAHRRLCEFMLAAPVQKQGMELPTPQGSLSVENLVLSIPGTDNLVLRGVSFVLPAGESLAVIGPSAAGKSTLARGLLGIWPPRAGAVRLDGADLSRMAREHVGKHLGYLPQDVELFEGTVAENIARLGEVDAEKVVASAKTAGLHDLILHLPDGYDTPLGPGGRGLSPGQRQRIGLARALYGEPRFVVLDEPNSNLDSEGEAALAAALERLRAARITTVIITHRANILAAVDKILLMRAGQVEAFGRRDDILPKLTRPAQSPRPVAAIGNN